MSTTTTPERVEGTNVVVLQTPTLQWALKRALLGIVILFVSTWWLSRVQIHTSQIDLAWRMLLLGIGLGPLQSLFSLAIQNASPMNRMGVVTSANQFFRQIGATISAGRGRCLRSPAGSGP